MNFFCLLQWMRKMGRKSVGISIILIIGEKNGVFSAAVNGGAEDSVMGSGLP